MSLKIFKIKLTYYVNLQIEELQYIRKKKKKLMNKLNLF